VSLIISCLYNIVDQIFVGQGIGYLANAATGIIFPITVIGWGLSLLFGDGGAAFLSIALGEGNAKHAGKAAANSALFSFLTELGLIIICYAPYSVSNQIFAAPAALRRTRVLQSAIRHAAGNGLAPKRRKVQALPAS
jgi:Na+-driven multidrug efflux pump